MKSARVAILGMGLMGGSLAWAIKDQAGTLVAADPDPRIRDLVRSAGLVEEIRPDPASVLLGAEVIILAAPVGEILDIIPRLPAWHPGEALVLDLGSTKKAICQRLAELPPRFGAVGGHPVCGRAVGGFENADPALFRGASFALCALERTSGRARDFAEALAVRVGSRPLWINPERHDRWVGATSHLPYLMSAVQVLVTPEDAAPVMGSGFRSATRLATTPRDMMLDVLRTNRSPLLEHLRNLRGVIGEMERLIQEGKYPELRTMLDRASALKTKFGGEG